MAVLVTEAFKKGFDTEGELTLFVDAFAHWKSNWPTREYLSELFGKDGTYVHPKVGGEAYKLRHVHLKPVIDQSSISLWTKMFRRGSRKTSNRALVYAHNGRGDYLLIYILSEPDAHEVAQMKSAANKAIMEGFANTAAAFMDDGSVIA